MTDLKAVLSELKQQRKNLSEAIDALDGVVNDGASSQPGHRGTISLAGRKRIAAAMKARWARIKGQSSGASASKPKAPAKRTISAAGRKRISAAAKARWARVRKAKRS
jgi:hypothetical protein